MVVKKTTGDSLRVPASLLRNVYFMKGFWEPEPVIPPHATTYTWGQDLMYSGVLERAVQSADSAAVTGVELKSDGAPWNNRNVSEVKNYYIQPAKNYIANRTPQNQNKVKMTGNLDQVFIDNDNDSAWISNNTNLQFTNSSRPVPEPVLPHNTTYVWGIIDNYYVRDALGLEQVRKSADSAEVLKVFLQSDGLGWGGREVSFIKDLYIMPIYDYMDDVGMPLSKQFKIIFIGILDYVWIDNAEDSAWISDNTQLIFTRALQDPLNKKHR